MFATSTLVAAAAMGEGSGLAVVVAVVETDVDSDEKKEGRRGEAESAEEEEKEVEAGAKTEDAASKERLLPLLLPPLPETRVTSAFAVKAFTEERSLLAKKSPSNPLRAYDSKAYVWR